MAIGRARDCALLVLTYRDDEVAVVSLLQRVLGGLRAPVAVRIPLGPLSARAVTQLAGDPAAGLRVRGSRILHMSLTSGD